MSETGPELSGRLHLAPVAQPVAAVAEEEWERRGIAFRSRAERGDGIAQYDPSASGSAVLANLLTQSLVFDQYDRAVREQDRALERRAESVQRRVAGTSARSEAAGAGSPAEPSRGNERK
jgi:hypothetical protein